MKKESALDMACKEYAKCIRKYVPMDTNQNEDDLLPFKKQVESLKEDFKRGATIPDGWDAVKKRIRELNRLMDKGKNKTEENIPVILIESLRDRISELETLCKVNGIEVEDEYR